MVNRKIHKCNGDSDFFKSKICRLLVILLSTTTQISKSLCLWGNYFYFYCFMFTDDFHHDFSIRLDTFLT